MARSRRWHVRQRMVAAALAAVTAAVAVAACGIGEDGPVERIPDEDVPFGLNEATTTSTSTTTTTLPQLSTTTGVVTSTTLPTETVALYFINRGQISALPAVVLAPVTPDALVYSLQLGPPDDPSAGSLRTALPPIEIELIATTDGSGIATVDLPADFFTTLVQGVDQRLAIAQVVLTLVDNVPGVGQVRFTQAGVGISVPREDGSLAAPGEALNRLDYDSLLTALPTGDTATTVSVGVTSTTTTAPGP